MKKVLIAGLLGAVALFMWGFLSNMVLQITAMGLHHIDNEDNVLKILKENIPNPGIYLIPGLDMSKDVTDQEKMSFAIYSSKA